MPRGNIPVQGGNNMIMGGGDGSYVSGEMLKQVSTPVETLLGFANGALSGLVISGAASGLLSFAQSENKTGFLKSAAKNWTGAHKWPIIGATVALGALGAVVRHSRADKHNEWSDKHYAFLEQQQAEKTAAANFTEKLNSGRGSEPQTSR